MQSKDRNYDCVLPENFYEKKWLPENFYEKKITREFLWVKK